MSLLIAAAVFLALAPSAGAATSFGYVGQFGGSGAGAGQFHATTYPQRMAVHDASGQVFVADPGNGRVQVFTPTEGGADFAFAIPLPSPMGVAVNQDTADLYVTLPQIAGTNEVQRLTVLNATSGTFTLSFAGDTTAPIAYNATAAVIADALRALPSVGGANVNGSGVAGTDASRIRTLTFVGALAATDVAQITVDGSQLNAEASAATDTVTGGIPVVPTQIRRLNPLGDPTAPTGYLTDSTFTSPLPGPAAGQLGSLQGTTNAAKAGGIAVGPAGEIVIVDVGKNLIQRYNPDGSFINAFNGCAPGPSPACSARPAFTGLRDLTVNAEGEIIVTDVQGTQARVDRYSSSGAHLATLSQANNPIPNNWLNNGGPVLAASRFSNEVVVAGKAGSALDQQPSFIHLFEDDALAQVFGPTLTFGGVQPIFSMAVGGHTPPRLYALGLNPLASPFGPRVQVFDAILPALVSDVTVDDLAPTSATLKGVITPQGFATTWHFEYRKVGASTWTRLPDPDASAGDGNEPVAVEYELTGLQPFTNYEARLRATTFGQESHSENVTVFQTAKAAPIVETRTAMLITDTSVTLRGRIDARNIATSYRFEYGIDSPGEHTTPEFTAEQTGAFAPASASISGLEPGTQYRFRLIAENEAGETAGETFAVRTLAEPLPERAFEVVSQTPADGTRLFNAADVVSEDGSRVLYEALEGSPHLPGYDLPHRNYLAIRGEDGWETKPADLTRVVAGGADGYNSITAAASLARWAISSTKSMHPDDQNEGSVDNPRAHFIGKDLYFNDGLWNWTWLSRPIDALPFTGDSGFSIGGASPAVTAWSPSGDTFVFQSTNRLVSDDPYATGSGLWRLYKWSKGEIKLIGKRPDGSVVGAASGLGIGSRISDAEITPNVVSRDGSRVFWSLGSQSYVQIDGRDSTTDPVGPVAVPSGSTFAWADRDLRRAFLRNSGRLLAFDVDSGDQRDLTGDVGLLGLASASDDGSRVYFVASGVVGGAEASPLGNSPSPGEPNLYLAEISDFAGPVKVKFIAALGAPTRPGDASVWSGNWDQRAAYGSPDGETLAFGSVRSLTGDKLAGTRQMFVYDNLAGTLECASCPADGSAPAGDVNGSVEPPEHRRGLWQTALGFERFVSATGSVFFDTASRLLPQDRNQVRDVYEYRRGSLRLISTGRPSAEDATFTGASKDGSTAFLMVSEALVPQDVDPGAIKIYASRIGGGFEYVLPQPPCRDDECQGGSGSPPLDQSGATAGIRGSGNYQGGEPIERSRIRLVSRKVRGVTAVIGVHVSGPGRLKLSGRGIKPSARMVTAGGTVRLRASLRPALAKRLRRSGKARVQLRLVFTPDQGRPAVHRLKVNYKQRVRAASSVRSGRKGEN